MLGQDDDSPISPDDFVVDCGRLYGEEKEKLTCCDKKEVCAKAKAQNKKIEERRKAKKPARVNTNSKTYDKSRNIVGPNKQSKFRRDFVKKAAAKKNDLNSSFLADCRFEKWEKTRSLANLDADHVEELQFGGAPGCTNIKFTSSRVNRMFGSSASNFAEDNTAIRPHGNCDCSNTAKCA